MIILVHYLGVPFSSSARDRARLASINFVCNLIVSNSIPICEHKFPNIPCNFLFLRENVLNPEIKQYYILHSIKWIKKIGMYLY